MPTPGLNHSPDISRRFPKVNWCSLWFSTLHGHTAGLRRFTLNLTKTQQRLDNGVTVLYTKLKMKPPTWWVKGASIHIVASYCMCKVINKFRFIKLGNPLRQHRTPCHVMATCSKTEQAKEVQEPNGYNKTKRRIPYKQECTKNDSYRKYCNNLSKNKVLP